MNYHDALPRRSRTPNTSIFLAHHGRLFYYRSRFYLRGFCEVLFGCDIDFKISNMIFKISRTSQWDGENPPISGAVKRPFKNWQTRTLSEEAFNKMFGEREGLWRSEGKNHNHDKQGFCTRQMDDIMVWSVEINTLEELIKMSNDYGDIVFTSDSLEIYDDYRE